jgi:hypothetical protein
MSKAGEQECDARGVLAVRGIHAGYVWRVRVDCFSS